MLGMNGSSVAVTWGFTGSTQSSYAIVGADGKVAFVSSSSVPYSQRYNTYKQAMIDKLNEMTAPTGVEHISDETPDGFILYQNSPNPFVIETTFRFSLRSNAQSATTRLVIYDLLGREIRTIADGQFAAGTYTGSWDGRNAQGVSVPPGIYFYVLESGANRAVKRMVYWGK